MMIYLSSSWKNRDRVRKLAIAIRKFGFEVYDFTDPACRSEEEIPPERYPVQFDPATMVYKDYLRSLPVLRAAVEGNKAAIAKSGMVILILPCGIDATADWAFAVGRGIPTCVVGHPLAGERSPVHLWANMMFNTDEELLQDAEAWTDMIIKDTLKTKPSVTLQYRPKVPGSMGTFSDWVDYDRTAYSVFEHERHLAEEHAKELTKNISHLGYEFRVKPPSNELPPPRCITEPCKKCGLMKGSMTAHGICSDCWWTTRGRAIRNPEFDANFCSKSKDGKHELDQNVDVYCRHCGRSSIHPIHPEEVDW